MFSKRIGKSLKQLGKATTSANGCPEIWELQSGDFAVIGVRKTGLLKAGLPQEVACGPDEEIVVIPRELLVAAKSGIPEK